MSNCKFRLFKHSVQMTFPSWLWQYLQVSGQQFPSLVILKPLIHSEQFYIKSEFSTHDLQNLSLQQICFTTSLLYSAKPTIIIKSLNHYQRDDLHVKHWELESQILQPYGQHKLSFGIRPS